MSSSHAVSNIQETMKRIDLEYEQKRNEALSGIRNRLDEIENTRRELDREEMQILNLLGDTPKSKPGAPKQKRRVSSGKRVTSEQKRGVIQRLIDGGHIKNGGEMTKELRSVLKDEGFNAPDLAGLGRLFPQGWEVRKNGQRGVLAKTEFHKHG